MSLLSAQLDTLASLAPIQITGTVASLRGLTLLVRDLPLPTGALVRIEPVSPTAAASSNPRLAQVVGFDGDHTIVMTLHDMTGIRPADRVVSLCAGQTVPVSSDMLSRVIDALGNPIDSKGPIHDTLPRPLTPPPISALSRDRITKPIHTGIRTIDLMTTLGQGQRMGIFAGPGVGKSTLLGDIARGTNADINVIALIGERGREVREFLDDALGKQGLARSVVIVATGDESPLMRVRAAQSACTIAEYFRDLGASVMLMMDSVTRFAHAQRQIGLSVGEPPATRGYTPSVFAELARLLERAGSTTLPDGTAGSITGLYTVLVEGDDMTEPIADAAQGILDGHLILSRKLAQRAHFPAIDTLDSVSRVAPHIIDQAHADARTTALRLLASYAEIEELLQIGAYAPGSNPTADIAIQYHPHLLDILQQPTGQPADFAAARSRLVKLAAEASSMLAQAAHSAPHAQQPRR